MAVVLERDREAAQGVPRYLRARKGVGGRAMEGDGTDVDSSTAAVESASVMVGKKGKRG